LGPSASAKHSCVKLGAVQTPSTDLRKKADDASMIEWYLFMIKERSEEWMAISRTIVADAFFSAFDFVYGITKLGFNFVGWLKENAYLRYQAVPDPHAPRRRGRKAKYGKTEDFSNPDMSIFNSFIYTDSKGVATRCLYAIVHSRTLKREIKIVICPGKDGKPIVYFTTELSMSSDRIVGFFRTRFQIEFDIRDAKQFTGLQSSQTRDRQRLDFAFNLSFTTLNICKTVIREDYPNLTLAQFKRLMFESDLASTTISTY
jgi:hypothetical protein